MNDCKTCIYWNRRSPDAGACTALADIIVYVLADGAPTNLEVLTNEANTCVRHTAAGGVEVERGDNRVW